MIGTGIGVIPGVGGVVASFLSYGVAQKASKNPEMFGNGSIEGLIASEVANDAKEGGALLPTVAFGIPGSADMAVLLAAFILHGLDPGPLLLTQHLDVVVTLGLGLTLSQVIGSGFVLILSKYIVRLATIKSRHIAPIVIMICFGGAYSINTNLWDVLTTVFFGFIGYFMKRYGYPVIPVVIGYMLGGMAETAFHQSLMISDAHYLIFFSSPICIVAFIIVIFTLRAASAYGFEQPQGFAAIFSL